MQDTLTPHPQHLTKALEVGWHGVRTRVNYRHGVLEGKWAELREDGSVKAEALYRDGRGEWVEYSKSGRVQKRASRRDEILEGDYVVFFCTGRERRRATYQDGKLSGAVTEFYANGQVKNRARYDGGVLSGLVEAFYEDGTPRYHAEFKAGVLTGRYVWSKAATRSTDPKELIRQAVLAAAWVEGNKRPFSLRGYRHEARISLETPLMAVLRGFEVPRDCVSRAYYYPLRVLRRAASSLNRRLGWSPIEIKLSRHFYGSNGTADLDNRARS